MQGQMTNHEYDPMQERPARWRRDTNKQGGNAAAGAPMAPLPSAEIGQAPS
jgi:hypothetical protein